MRVEIIQNIIVFEWDEGNLYKNVAKHYVNNKESEEIFSNKPLLIFDDAKHSASEKRNLILGKTNEGKQLSIIVTIRGSRIRIISARLMSKKERKIYEKAKDNTTI